MASPRIRIRRARLAAEYLAYARQDLALVESALAMANYQEAARYAESAAGWTKAIRRAIATSMQNAGVPRG